MTRSFRYCDQIFHNNKNGMWRFIKIFPSKMTTSEDLKHNFRKRGNQHSLKKRTVIASKLKKFFSVFAMSISITWKDCLRCSETYKGDKLSYSWSCLGGVRGTFPIASFSKWFQIPIPWRNCRLSILPAILNMNFQCKGRLNYLHKAMINRRCYINIYENRFQTKIHLKTSHYLQFLVLD